VTGVNHCAPNNQMFRVYEDAVSRAVPPRLPNSPASRCWAMTGPPDRFYWVTAHCSSGVLPGDGRITAPQTLVHQSERVAQDSTRHGLIDGLVGGVNGDTPVSFGLSAQDSAAETMAAVICQWSKGRGNGWQ
jgi:hypothetical protein